MGKLVEIKKTFTISISVDEDFEMEMSDWLDERVNHHISLIEEMVEEEEERMAENKED